MDKKQAQAQKEIDNMKQSINSFEESINSFEERIKHLETIINAPEGIRYKPELNDEYYCIHTDGTVYSIVWSDYTFDKSALSIGNIRKTREEAEQVVTARKIETRLYELADKANGERFNIHNIPYYTYWIYCQKNSDRINIGNTSIFIHQYAPCFYIREDAEKALQTLISEFGESEVQMYVSGVWR